MNELALFAGAGGGILGGHLLGWRTVCAVERDAYAAQVLAQRQNDGILRPFPIWSDVTTFDGKPWRGIIDVISGGFPCQDISVAGSGAGLDGERSGLWSEFARIIGEVRPRFVFVENSPALTSRGHGVVLGDLAAMGFDAEWGVVSAKNAGAPQLRERIWIVAHSTNEGIHERGRLDCSEKEVQKSVRIFQNGISSRVGKEKSDMARRGYSGSRWWGSESNVGRVANGVAYRMDRLKAIGNGQVPAVAATAFDLLSG